MVLLYGNRSVRDVLLKEKLDEWSKQHFHRFKVHATPVHRKYESGLAEQSDHLTLCLLRLACVYMLRLIPTAVGGIHGWFPLGNRPRRPEERGQRQWRGDHRRAGAAANRGVVRNARSGRRHESRQGVGMGR